MKFSVVFLGHQGHYRCTICDLARPVPDVAAQDVVLDGLDGGHFRLVTQGEAEPVSIGLPGLYNVYNALGAAATAVMNGIAISDCVRGLSNVQAAFGRMEKLQVEGRTVQLALAKNPAGLNEVVRTVATSGEPLNLMLMLNDDTADGHDVSWIWDADIELLEGRIDSVCFSGRRAADMALRFKYAGLLTGSATPQWTVIFDAESALRQALQWTPRNGRLFIIPTYTAMLDVRGVLARLGHVRQYWEE
jgi:UDP-N-acetylmuramyl tripeptide synthase